MSDALRLENVTRTFVQGDAEIAVLRGVNAHLVRGEIVALLGPSGSGKSTLLQAVGLLEGGFGGRIIIDGVDVAGFDQGERTRVRREQIGFVYQFHHLLPDFDALDNVILPQLVHGTAHADAAAHAAALLGRLGLDERLHHKPNKLSGGEQQRVAVARALANSPLLVLADEPTGNLDEKTADIVFDQFVALVRDQGSAALVATHNERLAARMDRVWRLHDGVVTATSNKKGSK
ncbi:MAG: ABC transporter ATP-binding protein [Sphingopyxis sp.]|nr:ABC transporter ATP-binding protein [Sphingopyxis sp.]